MEEIASLNFQDWLITLEAKIRAGVIPISFRYALAIAHGNESRLVRILPKGNFSVEKLSNFNQGSRDFDCAVFFSWKDIQEVLSKRQTLSGLWQSGGLTWKGSTEASLILHRLILE